MVHRLLPFIDNSKGIQTSLMITCVPALPVAQAEVVAERQNSAVHVLHAGCGEDSRLLPGPE